MEFMKKKTAAEPKQRVSDATADKYKPKNLVNYPLERYLNSTRNRPATIMSSGVKEKSSYFVKSEVVNYTAEKASRKPAYKSPIDAKQIHKQPSIQPPKKDIEFIDQSITLDLGLSTTHNITSVEKRPVNCKKNIRANSVLITSNLDHLVEKSDVQPPSENEKINEELKHQNGEYVRQIRILNQQKDRLEFDVKKLNHEKSQLERRIEINDKSEEIEAVVQQLSGMMLSSVNKANLSREQIKLIKYLFGDIATEGYKQRIKSLEQQLENKVKE